MLSRRLMYRIMMTTMRRNSKSLLLLLSQTLFILLLWKILASSRGGTNDESKMGNHEFIIGKLPHAAIQTTDASDAFGDRTAAEEEGHIKLAAAPVEKIPAVSPVDEGITSVYLLYQPSTQCDSLQNILLRKAINKKLNIALPQYGKDSLCYPKLYTGLCPRNQMDAPFDMIIHQLRFDKREIHKTIKDDAKFIGLLRHPVVHLQAVYYENMWSDYVGGLGFGSYIQYHYNRFAKTYDFDKNSPYRNLQFFNFGLSPSLMDNRDLVIQRVEAAKHIFDLVLIQERFMESLILLKYELKWSYEEMVVFGIHSHPENYPNKELTKAVNETIILYNEADMRLYEGMLEQFEDKLEIFGHAKMKEEMGNFQKVINKETEHCLDKHEEEMRQQQRRDDYRLSWEGEGDRYCHFHIARGPELTGLIRMWWEDKELERKKKVLEDED